MIQDHGTVVQDTTQAAAQAAGDAAHGAAADTAAPVLDLGEVILHHTADAWTLELHPFESLPLHMVHLPRFNDIHLFGLTVNLSPTKHVVFMVFVAALVFLVLWLTGRMLTKQRAGERAPHGFAAAMEAFVLWVRNDIAIANIGHNGAKFAPLIMTLFFFILFSNVMGLDAAAVQRDAVGQPGVHRRPGRHGVFHRGDLGHRHTGAQGLPAYDLPQGARHVGRRRLVMSLAMAPIEVIGKLVKPFALAVRLFGNMTAGHFVILALFGIIFLFGAAAVRRQLGHRHHHRGAGHGDHDAGTVRGLLCRPTCLPC